MTRESGFQCAGCGEWNYTLVDSLPMPRQAKKQSYVEDCQVCCRPNLLVITYDSEAEEYLIVAKLES